MILFAALTVSLAIDQSHLIEKVANINTTTTTSYVTVGYSQALGLAVNLATSIRTAMFRKITSIQTTDIVQSFIVRPISSTINR
jgi:ribosomal protein L7Ae-like RNA K-turn-binding protein